MYLELHPIGRIMPGTAILRKKGFKYMNFIVILKVNPGW
jgi:hypothetical protein